MTNPFDTLSRFAGKFLPEKSKKPALAPGTLVYIGEERTGPVRIQALEYDADSVSELKQIEPSGIDEIRQRKKVFWLNFDGVHDIAVVEKLAGLFQIHPLVAEDIVHTGQRPKTEDHDDYLYVVMKMLMAGPDGEIRDEQLSIIFNNQFVLSFQEQQGDVFDPVRERIKGVRWRARKLGSPYLAYALIDAVVDHYFVIMDQLGRQVEEIEAELDETVTVETLQKIYRLKREIVFVKKAVWPMREVVNDLLRSENDLIDDTMKSYYRDVYDHTIQVMDLVETFRDMLSGMQDLYLSLTSQKMNEIMKVLTVIATVFIPPTFIAGIYGMNFERMPELHYAWGYFGALGAMGFCIGGMLLYFKRKKWL